MAATSAPGLLRTPAEAIDLDEARRALTAVSRRTAALLARIDDPGRRVSGLTWTAGETAAHLLIGLRLYTDAAEDRAEDSAAHIPDTPSFRERLAGMNARTIGLEPQRDAATMSRVLREYVDAWVDSTARRPGDETIAMPWYGPHARLPLSAATCMLLGEQIVHGYDLAGTVGTPWPIARHEALLVIEAILAMMPLTVDPVTVRGVNADFALHARGGPSAVLHIAAGSARVDRWVSQRVDCHISIDPTACVLLAYGRISQWHAIARGRLMASGRKPWRALRLTSYFVNP